MTDCCWNGAALNVVDEMTHCDWIRPKRCSLVDGIETPSYDHAPHGAVSSPVFASHALREITAIYRMPNNRAIVNSANSNCYVDDYLGSFAKKDTVKYYVVGLTKLLKKRGFHPTKWMPNEPRVLDIISANKRTQNPSAGSTAHTNRTTLGVGQWDAGTDECVLHLYIPDRPNTRVRIPSSASSLYNPLGFVLPVAASRKYVATSTVLEENWLRLPHSSKR